MTSNGRLCRLCQGIVPEDEVMLMLDHTCGHDRKKSKKWYLGSHPRAVQPGGLITRMFLPANTWSRSQLQVLRLIRSGEKRPLNDESDETSRFSIRTVEAEEIENPLLSFTVGTYYVKFI